MTFSLVVLSLGFVDRLYCFLYVPLDIPLYYCELLSELSVLLLFDLALFIVELLYSLLEIVYVDFLIIVLYFGHYFLLVYYIFLDCFLIGIPPNLA